MKYHTLQQREEQIKFHRSYIENMIRYYAELTSDIEAKRAIPIYLSLLDHIDDVFGKGGNRMTIQAHDQLQALETKIQRFDQQLSQLRRDYSQAIERLVVSGYDYELEQGYYNAIKQVQDLLKLTLQEDE